MARGWGWGGRKGVKDFKPPFLPCALAPSLVLPLFHTSLYCRTNIAGSLINPTSGDVIYTVVVSLRGWRRKRSAKEKEKTCALARFTHACIYLRSAPTIVVYARPYVCTCTHLAVRRVARKSAAQPLFVFRFTRAAGYDHLRDVIIRALALYTRVPSYWMIKLVRDIARRSLMTSRGYKCAVRVQNDEQSWFSQFDRGIIYITIITITWLCKFPNRSKYSN